MFVGVDADDDAGLRFVVLQGGLPWRDRGPALTGWTGL
jgi:hypothetical protein